MSDDDRTDAVQRMLAERLRHGDAFGKPQQRERRQPPQETGERLATLPRGDREELRVSWDVFRGGDGQERPFLSLRVWQRDADGGWWPVKGKGIAIRVRELAGVGEGIIKAIDRAAKRTGEGGR